MKITKEHLKQIIKEELDQVDFGKQKTSRGTAAANLKQRSKDMQSQKGVDDIERGIITQIEQLLTKLADETDIKSGAVSSNLKKIYNLLQKSLAGEQDEK
tara:strand:+ start:40 stop:339 length:300 start_codon:yes stop_codon:yes gene_type:complete